MDITRAHVIKLDPNREQEAYFRQACGVRRFVFNWTLSQYEAWWTLYSEDKKLKLPRPGWMKLVPYFNAVKDTLCPWVRDVASKLVTRAIRNADDAYKMWFKAMQRGDTQWGRPRRARWGVNERFYVHNQSLKFREKCVYIEKLGWVRCCENFRFPNGKILGGSVRRKADGWYLAVQVNIEAPDPPIHNGPEVGIDAGIAKNFTLSNGDSLELPRDRIAEVEKQIRRAQKTVGRRWYGKPKKGHEGKALRDENGKLLPKSKRFVAATRKVAKLKLKQARIRENSLHQFSRYIVDNYSTICIEDLQLKNMTKSAKGDAENPGSNVKAKSGLNREMLNVAIGEFRWMLTYKAEAAGAKIIPVDAAYTSQTCSHCEHTDPDNRRSQSAFLCVKCGHAENADVNAAKNILQKGISP